MWRAEDVAAHCVGAGGSGPPQVSGDDLVGDEESEEEEFEAAEVTEILVEGCRLFW